MPVVPVLLSSWECRPMRPEADSCAVDEPNKPLPVPEVRPKAELVLWALFCPPNAELGLPSCPKRPEPVFEPPKAPRVLLVALLLAPNSPPLKAFEVPEFPKIPPRAALLLVEAPNGEVDCAVLPPNGELVVAEPPKPPKPLDVLLPNIFD